MSSSCVQGKVPSREAIHLHYQEQMLRSSRESGLDCCSHDDQGTVSAGRRVGEEEEQTADAPPGEAAPWVEVPQGPTPPGGQAEDGGQEDGCSAAPRRHRGRPKLSRMDRVESSSSSSDEEHRVTCPLRWVSVRVGGADGVSSLL